MKLNKVMELPPSPDRKEMAAKPAQIPELP
jgi:hypothetical protein